MAAVEAEAEEEEVVVSCYQFGYHFCYHCYHFSYHVIILLSFWLSCYHFGYHFGYHVISLVIILVIMLSFWLSCYYFGYHSNLWPKQWRQIFSKHVESISTLL